MLELHLYREAFRDYKESAFRLLFEKDDVTAYVWISDYHTISAFQINFKEKYFYHFTAPDKISITGKSDKPLIRSINRQLDATEQEMITGIVEAVDNSQFKNLFRKIRSIAKGKVKDLDLQDDEIAVLDRMQKMDIG